MELLDLRSSLNVNPTEQVSFASSLIRVLVSSLRMLLFCRTGKIWSGNVAKRDWKIQVVNKFLSFEHHFFISQCRKMGYPLFSRKVVLVGNIFLYAILKHWFSLKYSTLYLLLYFKYQSQDDVLYKLDNITLQQKFYISAKKHSRNEQFAYWSGGYTLNSQWSCI